MRCVRGCRNTVVLFDISNSTKPYPSVVHAYAGRSRPVIGCLLSQHTSMRLPPVFRQPLKGPGIRSFITTLHNTISTYSKHTCLRIYIEREMYIYIYIYM